MVKQCTILFGCMALGELLVRITGLSLPGSIIGMLLLAAFLEMGWIKLEWVKEISDFLLSNLGFFFVPPGVAIMLYLDVIQKELLPIVMATVLSTILVLVVTGHMHQFVVKAERKIMAMNLRKKQKTKENSNAECVSEENEAPTTLVAE